MTILLTLVSIPSYSQSAINITITNDKTKVKPNEIITSTVTVGNAQTVQPPIYITAEATYTDSYGNTKTEVATSDPLQVNRPINIKKLILPFLNTTYDSYTVPDGTVVSLVNNAGILTFTMDKILNETEQFSIIIKSKGK